MKNTKKKENIDVIAEARKHPKYAEYIERFAIRRRFAEEMFAMRQQKGLSQQALAKEAKTTQKVISNIENGDVNIGLDSMNRIGKSLEFSAENWGRVFNFKAAKEKVYIVPQIDFKSDQDFRYKPEQQMVGESLSINL